MQVFQSPAFLEALESRVLLSADVLPAELSRGVWRITGDSNPDNLADQIVIQAAAGDEGMLEARINGEVVGTAAAAEVRSIRVWSGDGDDVVVIDLPAEASGIRTILYGGAGDDSLSGGSGDDRLYGGSGNDVLSGGGGSDRIFGGAGDDQLDGGAGNDWLYGDGGKDALQGGDGRDRLYGGSGDDSLRGGDGADRLYGGSGDDAMNAGAGDDRIYGESGSDTILPGEGRDYLSGGSGRDILYGKDGDRVSGENDLSMGDAGDGRLAQAASAEQYRQYVIDLALRQYGNLLGQLVDERPWYWDWYRGPMDGLARPVMMFASSSAADGQNAAVRSTDASYDGTNVQVAGVDEADLVKTDGRYIYTLNGRELSIVDAADAADMHVTGSYEVDDWASGLFVFGDRVAIVSPSWGNVYALALGGELSPRRPQQSTTVTILDVSDRTQPELVQTMRIDGWLVDLRAIEEQVYVAVGNALYVPAPMYELVDREPVMPEPSLLLGEYGIQLAICPPYRFTDHARQYESRDSYIARLEAMDIGEFLPHVTTTNAEGEVVAEGLLADPEHIYLPNGELTEELLTLARIDMTADDGGLAASSTVQGRGGTVYSSASSFYIAASNWSRDNNETSIYKFDITEPDLPLAATGVVPGTVKDQYSMDESAEGLLRIVTTVRGPETFADVFVLADVGDDLLATGELTGLAPGETVQSVRFVDELAYVVTFRQIDPLFAIDLSEGDPEVLGELEMPGFSTFMQPVDEGHLIGIGYAADANGRITGMKLSLYDVTDPTAPSEVDTMLLSPNGAWSSWSEALWNPKAFSYFASYGVLALPVNEWYPSYDSSVRVIDVDVETGFEELGRIAQDGWTSRTLRIGEVVYAVSSESIVAASITDPSSVIGKLSLAG